MELLAEYGELDTDSESEPDGRPAACADKGTVTSVSKTGIFKESDSDDSKEDYFSLHCSDDDDDDDTDGEVEKFQMDKVSTRCPRVRSMDTVISAYQLGGTDVGPEASSAQPRPYIPSKHKRIRRNSPQIDTSDISNYNLSDSPCHSPQRSRDSLSGGLSILQPNPYPEMSGKGVQHSRLPRSVTWRFSGHRGSVNTLHWGLVPYSHLLLSSSMDGSARIWNIVESKCVWRGPRVGSISNQSAIRCARWCPCEHHLVAIGGYDKAVRVLDVEKDSEVFSGVHHNFVNCIAIHPAEPHTILCGTAGSIECWDTRRPATVPVHSYQGDFGEVQDIAFLSNCGSEFVSCTNLVTRDSANRTIMAWDFASGAVLSNQIFNERYHCTCLRVHPSGKWFLAQTNGNYIALFSTARPFTMNKKKRYEGHKIEGYWVGCDVSRDGQFVYSGSADGSLHAYSFRTSAPVARWQVSDVSLLAVDVNPALEGTVAVSDIRGAISVWQ